MAKKQETYASFQSRFQDQKPIGSGGFAQVYRVFDEEKQHEVALKIADVKSEWGKFTLKNEVELVNKLDYHRNIARYDACYRFDTGITGVKDFAILKFYKHGNLEQFLRKEKANLTEADKESIIRGILGGVAFLHNNNIIHRDLKSQNILLHKEDDIWMPKITDFGLSREVIDQEIIENSAIGLSYAYAAPEQIKNQNISANVDLWAAGVIIYRIIADELPFKEGKSTQSKLGLSEKITKLILPSKLETLREPYKSMIKRCLVLNPAERTQTAQELIGILNEYKNSAPALKTNSASSSPSNAAQYPKGKKEEKRKKGDKPKIIKKKKKRFNWWLVFIPLMLNVIAFGVWWGYKNGHIFSEQKLSSKDKQKVLSKVTDKDVTVIRSRYERLDSLNDAALKSKGALKRTQAQIKLNVITLKGDNKNYRLHYLMAKNLAYQVNLGKKRKTIAVFKSLIKAAKIAIDNDNVDEMLKDIKDDEVSVFYHIQKVNGGKKWNNILKPLKEAK